VAAEQAMQDNCLSGGGRGPHTLVKHGFVSHLVNDGHKPLKLDHSRLMMFESPMSPVPGSPTYSLFAAAWAGQSTSEDVSSSCLCWLLDSAEELGSSSVVRQWRMHTVFGNPGYALTVQQNAGRLQQCIFEVMYALFSLVVAVLAQL
jgi:hypothetical protein